MNFFKIIATVGLDTSDFDKKIQASTEKGKKFGDGMGKSLLNGTKNLAVGTVKAIGIVSGAVGTLIGKSVMMAGELEQNLGGAEAVFGDFADTIKERGASAFETMGLSQSKFLATTNKMGSLFQGAGFDIETSMSLSSNAMQRAADVASIMGIDVNVAMDSIAGAAKGNFTMMDNLGVAMNDTAIQNYALSKGIDVSTASMTQQEKIGLAMEMFLDKTAYATGNYAKENETLAGSLSTTKAAFGNFMSGTSGIEPFIKSLTNLSKIVIKSVTKMAPKIIEGITSMLNAVVEQLPTLIGEILPQLIEMAVQLITSLITAFSENAEIIFNGVVKIINTIAIAFLKLIPQIIQLGLDLIIAIALGIVDALPELIPAVIETIKKLVDTLTSPKMLTKLIMAAIDLILALSFGLIDALPELLAMIPVIISNLTIALTSPEMLTKLVMAAIELIVALSLGLVQAIPELAFAVPKIVKSLVDNFLNMNWKEVGWNILKGILDGFSNIGNLVDNAVKKVGNSIMKNIKNFFGIKSPSTLMKKTVGKFLGMGLVDGFIEDVDGSKNDINNSIMDAFGGAKGVMGLDINSTAKGINGMISTAPTYINLTTVTNLDGEVLNTSTEKVTAKKKLQYQFS